jgi:peroxiredoxin
MKAWGEKLNAGDKVKFFADPDGSFTKAIHMDMNLGGEHYPYEE